ncbi:MAG: hypothetical protein LBV23_01120 [Deltaproteobacteria bacterium]|jgi:NitT/TauT family transport system substrate-binding protein|nr:hypothetical protein [Deltaproteobacteria bacterium]
MSRKTDLPAWRLFLIFSILFLSILAIFPFTTRLRAALKPVTIFSALTATSAQLPLLGAIKDGWPGRDVKIEWWKNLDELRSVVLSGKGEIWVGHLETFARAAARGAPVKLSSVTVWRKFYFISAPLSFDPGGPERYPNSVEELLDWASKRELVVPMAPQNSPAEGLLKSLISKVGHPILSQGLAPQQLSLELIEARRPFGLMPEPLASQAALKSERLKIIGSLEEFYSSHFGGQGLIPQAGIAVNLNFYNLDPGLTYNLVALMSKWAQKITDQGSLAAIELLPLQTQEALGLEVLKASLTREPILARPTWEVKSEIDSFLRLSARELYQNSASGPPNTFFLAPR